MVEHDPGTIELRMDEVALLDLLVQGWPWARARWATALGLTSKLGLILKSFKALIILKGLKNNNNNNNNITLYKKLKRPIYFKQTF
jgi:hypothetical protein